LFFQEETAELEDAVVVISQPLLLEMAKVSLPLIFLVPPVGITRLALFRSGRVSEAGDDTKMAWRNDRASSPDGWVVWYRFSVVSHKIWCCV